MFPKPYVWNLFSSGWTDYHTGDMLFYFVVAFKDRAIERMDRVGIKDIHTAYSDLANDPLSTVTTWNRVLWMQSREILKTLNKGRQAYFVDRNNGSVVLNLMGWLRVEWSVLFWRLTSTRWVSFQTLESHSKTIYSYSLYGKKNNTFGTLTCWTGVQK